MDNPGPRQVTQRQARPRGAKQSNPTQNPQLFEDTSTQQIPYGQTDFQEQPQIYNSDAPQSYDYYPQDAYGGMPQTYDPSQGYGQEQTGYSQSHAQFPGQQYLQDPMANMAMQYGETLAHQSKDYVNKNLEKYVSTSKLKYYFAVDTAYVGKKLGLLLFPFAHTDWSVRYNQDEPVAPRYEINAPDLYIPVMAFVTYILVAGMVLGTNNRFTPEQLGLTASTALVWLAIEIIILLLVMYILNVSTDLKYLDLIAYCGYKYVGMIMSLLAGLLLKSIGYYLVLLWTSISLAFFLIRALKLAIIPHADADAFTKGSKRRLYMLLTVALSQPVFMWWLTSHLL